MRLPEDTTRPVSKSRFAAEVGLSKGRISQLVGQGLPVRPDGKIDRDTALDWMEANLDPTRRKPAYKEKAETGPALPTAAADASLKDLKAEHEAVKVARARLALEKERGELVDRTTAERVILDRARQERDAHLNWVLRTAPLLAAELGVDSSQMFGLLEREMRDHLQALAETPLEGLQDARDS